MTLPTLTSHQHDAVGSVVEWFRDCYDPESWDRSIVRNADGDYVRSLAPGQAYVLGGYAGTGKSTILPFIIEKMGLDLTNVAFCAPTGKAAKVMGQKLKAFGIWNTPTTIHKLIYMPKSARAEAIDAQLKHLQACYDAAYDNAKEGGADPAKMMVNAGDGPMSAAQALKRIDELKKSLARAMEDDDGPSFTLRTMDEFPEQVKLIVVDEASMVGREIADDLASFNRPIFAMGDPGQLPPVKDSHGFDMRSADFFLTEIHRQAADNPIIYLATRARNGEELQVGDYGQGVRVLLRRDDDVTYDTQRDAMVIVGTHKKRWMVTHNIRKALGITDTGPCVDEPLLIKRNSRAYPGLVNGTIVRNLSSHGDLISGRSSLRISAVDDEVGQPYNFLATQGLFEEHLFRKRNAYSCTPQQAFFANRNYEHVDFAHAITCHSSQGSQWDEVIVHDESMVFREDADKWLYTAVTRAAERLTVLV